ncbi:MAG: potassium-transporting ATPase subunit KdpA [Steroidobacteraceae bacterium]
MNWNSLAEYFAFIAILTVTVRPVGSYLAKVFTYESTFFDPLAVPVERVIVRLVGPAAQRPMKWQEYFLAFMWFGLAGAAFVFLILKVQHLLPFYRLLGKDVLSTPMTDDLAFNTAISFATTTTWQAYGGETTMSYFSQIVALASQNFLAAAAGLAIGIAFIRGIATDGGGVLGNFWRDVIRAMLWVLLPLSVPGALILVWQGVPMNLHGLTAATTLQGAPQLIAQGPVAALEFIKNLGTNGGGFFNANGAHPYENPTAISNFVEILAIVMLPAALCHTFGRMTGQRRHGWLLYWVMTGLFGLGLAGVHWAENAGNPALVRAAAPQTFAAGDTAWSGNTEGKEVRFGTNGTTLAVVATSNGAAGSTAAAADSLSPLGGGIAFFNMLLGELTYGGLGTGLVSMILAALLAVFIGALMIGRSPAYLGNQIGVAEMKLIAVHMFIAGMVILPLTGVAVMSPAGRAGLTTNLGPHGLTSIAFAYTSSFANNGQSFAGLSANSAFYNYTTAVAMLAGRFLLTLPALALAGALAAKRRRGITSGSLPADSGLFAVLLVATILLVAGLNFLPLLCLGPVAEHIMLWP